MYEGINDFNVLMESVVITYHDDAKLNTLNEAEKMKFADQIVTKLFKDIKKKTLSSPDMKEISKTKGDFTKHGDYKTIGKALRFLDESASQNQHTELANRVKVLKDTHELLASNKDIFVNAFKFGNDVLIISYCNICAGLIAATSEALSLNTQLINSKTISGSIVSTRNFGGKSNYIEGLKEVNELMRNNKMRLINDKVVVKNEAFLAEAQSKLTLGKLVKDEADRIGKLSKPARWSAGIGGTLLGVFLLIQAIRKLCFTYYSSKIKLADHARNTAEFVQLKSENIADKNVKAKQQKWIDKLLAFAEKIDVDSKNANAKADAEIKKTDQEISDMPTTWMM